MDSVHMTRLCKGGVLAEVWVLSQATAEGSGNAPLGVDLRVER